MSEICTVYPKGKRKALPEGFRVDPAIAKRLGLKDGQEVTKPTLGRIMRLMIGDSQALLDRIAKRQSQVKTKPTFAANGWRRGETKR